jgi:hypothetical protein
MEKRERLEPVGGPNQEVQSPKRKPELLRSFHAKTVHTSRSIVHKMTQIILTTNNITHNRFVL